LLYGLMQIQFDSHAVLVFEFAQFTPVQVMHDDRLIVFRKS